MDTFATMETERLYNHIVCPRIVTAESSKQFEAMIPGWISLPVAMHLLDFEKTEEIHTETYRHFVSFHRNLKLLQKELVSVNMNSNILKQINNDGLNTVFGHVRSMEEVKDKAQALKNKTNAFDVRFMNPVVAALDNILKLNIHFESLHIDKATLVNPFQIDNQAIIIMCQITAKDFFSHVLLEIPAKTYKGFLESLDPKPGGEEFGKKLVDDLTKRITHDLSKNHTLEFKSAEGKMTIGSALKVKDPLTMIVTNHKSNFGTFKIAFGALPQG